MSVTYFESLVVVDSHPSMYLLYGSTINLIPGFYTQPRYVITEILRLIMAERFGSASLFTYG